MPGIEFQKCLEWDGSHQKWASIKNKFLPSFRSSRSSSTPDETKIIEAIGGSAFDENQVRNDQKDCGCFFMCVWTIASIAIVVFLTKWIVSFKTQLNFSTICLKYFETMFLPSSYTSWSKNCCHEISAQLRSWNFSQRSKGTFLETGKLREGRRLSDTVAIVRWVNLEHHRSQYQSMDFSGNKLIYSSHFGDTIWIYCSYFSYWFLFDGTSTATWVLSWPSQSHVFFLIDKSPPILWGCTIYG